MGNSFKNIGCLVIEGSSTINPIDKKALKKFDFGQVHFAKVENDTKDKKELIDKLNESLLLFGEGVDKILILSTLGNTKIDLVKIRKYLSMVDCNKEELRLCFNLRQWLEAGRLAFEIYDNSFAYTKGYCTTYGTLDYYTYLTSRNSFNLNGALISKSVLESATLEDGKYFDEYMGSNYDFEFICRVMDERNEVSVSSISPITTILPYSEYYIISEEDFESVKSGHTNKTLAKKRKRNIKLK